MEVNQIITHSHPHLIPKKFVGQFFSFAWMKTQTLETSPSKSTSVLPEGTNASQFKTAVAYFIANMKWISAISIGFFILGVPGSGLLLTTLAMSNFSPVDTLAIPWPSSLSHITCFSLLQSNF